MKYSRVFALMVLAGVVTGAHATNGYFSHGYGMKAKGMAGASTASSDDAFGGANNPASMAFAGNRFDLGIDIFSPPREASNTGGAFGPGTVTSDSDDKNYFPVPEIGYTHMLNNNLALGVSVYGNGGMNTHYASLGGIYGNTNLLGGTGSLGIDLSQLLIAPTVAFKIAPNHSIGISPLIGYQRFKAEGLQAFVPASTSPTNVTNNGYDDAFGYGVRIGYMGKITPTVTIGAAYASKMNFQEFDKYAGLFAGKGNFDIPENYNLGVAWQATPMVKLALDYQRINYSGVDSVGNQVLPNFANGMGASNGPGFGWDDMDIWKLGVEFKASQKLTLRAGYSHADSPIKGDLTCASLTNCGEVTLNILAPAIIEDQVTLGFTYTLPSGNELTMAYMHAFENEIKSARPAAFGGGVDSIKMYQNTLGIQFSWKM